MHDLYIHILLSVFLNHFFHILKKLATNSMSRLVFAVSSPCINISIKGNWKNIVMINLYTINVIYYTTGREYLHELNGYLIG